MGFVMHSKAKGPTAAEVRRWWDMAEVGCVACRMEGFGYQAPDMHHGTDGGRRQGHSMTAPLCPWHHRGNVPVQMFPEEAGVMYGPSLARHPRAFRARYGSDEDLVEYANRLRDIYQSKVVGGPVMVQV